MCYRVGSRSDQPVDQPVQRLAPAVEGSPPHNQSAAPWRSLPTSHPPSLPPSSTSLLLRIYFCLFPSHFPQSQPFALARQAPLRPPRRSGNMRAQEHGGRWLTGAAVASKDVHCGCTLPSASGWLTTWRRKEMENIWGHMGGTTTTTTTTTQANLLLCAHYVLTTCPRFLLNKGNKRRKNY